MLRVIWRNATAEFEGIILMRTVFHPTQLDEFKLSKLSPLSTEQKRGVEAFLRETLACPTLFGVYSPQADTMLAISIASA